MKGGMLIYFHVRSNTGYAMASNESAFLRAAARVCDPSRIHIAFTDLSRGGPPTSDVNVLEFRPRDPKHVPMIRNYVRKHGIEFALGYDQQPGQPSIRALREGGVKRIMTYWGAPISSLNRGAMLWTKRLQYRMTRDKPDAYIFESCAMARRATHGRGIPADEVHVAAPGVDHLRYQPVKKDPSILHSLGLPPGRTIIFYAGHMEKRKGVWLLMSAANTLARTRNDFHFLIFGNRPGQEREYLDMLSVGREHVTFGGYRNDLPDIMPQCDIGVVASTGWDSFPATALEMAACGLPIVVSDLDGLPETVEDGVTGYVTRTGDAASLSDALARLLNDNALRGEMGIAARQRIVSGYTLDHQTDALLRAWGVGGTVAGPRDSTA